MSSAATAPKDVAAYDDMLPHLTLGAGATRVPEGVSVATGVNGHAVHGPKWPLAAGDYLASFFITAEARWADRNNCVFVVEAVDGDAFLGQYGICGRDAENGVFDMRFNVPAGGVKAVELRVWTRGIISAEITKIVVSRLR